MIPSISLCLLMEINETLLLYNILTMDRED